MENKLTVGVMIGNASTAQTKSLIKGMYEAAEKEDLTLVFFVGTHSTSYYRSYFGESNDEDYDYQFNIVYDYNHLINVDALVVAYGNLVNYLNEKDKYLFLEKYNTVPIVLLQESDETGR